MRLALIGHGTAGKGEVARWLRQHTPLRYEQSTSEAAAVVVYRDPSMRSRYLCVDECFADRRRNREAWRKIILDYNQPDGLRLYREMVEENDILDGIRSFWELQACRDAGLVDKAVWVERSVPADPSLDIKAEDCDYLVENTKGLPDLHENLIRMCADLMIPFCDEETGYVNKADAVQQGLAAACE